MIYVTQNASKILDFLAAPVDFKDVPESMSAKDKGHVFKEHYMECEDAFHNPIKQNVREYIDTTYLAMWTDIYMKHFHKKGENVISTIDYFACTDQKELGMYIQTLDEYWQEVIEAAKSELEKPTIIAKNTAQECIRKSMPAKLSALRFGLMNHIYPGRFMNLYPVPNRMFIYALGQQLKSVQDAIKEVSWW